jgi:hypothetical protein
MTKKGGQSLVEALILQRELHNARGCADGGRRHSDTSTLGLL